MGLYDNDDPETLSPVTSDDLTCEVCGAALSYAGRGRKPRFCDEHKSKSSSSSTRTGTRSSVSSKELDQACDNLNMAYEALVLPFTLASPRAGAIWIKEIDQLNRSNRQFLAGNKELVRRINNVSSKAGTTGFMIAHAAAVAPVAAAIYQDFSIRRSAKSAQPTASYEYVSPDDVPEDDPDAPFRNM